MGSIKQNLANNILSGGKFDATDLDGTIPNTNINDNSIDNVTSFPAAGSGIPSVASDPPSPSQGDVWYNTTSNAFKYVGVTTAGSWATGTSINTARRDFAGNGTYTSALIAGGYTGTYVSISESWNGSAWTEVGDLNTARNGVTGAGADNTSALAAGGYSSTTLYTGITETWNGSNWTEVGDLNTARSALGGTGTQTAAIATGGNTPPNFSDTKTESWNGTSWTEVNDLNTARESVTSANTGTQTAALFAGGQQGNPPPNFNSALVESWNGTSWTEVGDLNTARENLANTGTQTSALVYGGSIPPETAATEEWNGTSWTEVNDLSTARSRTSSPGNVSSALAVAGYTGTANLSSVEEWTGAGSPVTKTVTTA
jgi:hypothetical protein